MPQTVGSKWVMKTTDRQGPTTITLEVAEPKEIAAQQVSPLLTKDAQGALTRGTLEKATENAYTLFGTIRMPRGQEGGEPTTSLYDPMVVFPATMTVGQHAEATTKMSMRGQPGQVTMKLDPRRRRVRHRPQGHFRGLPQACLHHLLRAGRDEAHRPGTPRVSAW